MRRVFDTTLKVVVSSTAVAVVGGLAVNTVKLDWPWWGWSTWPALVVATAVFVRVSRRQALQAALGSVHVDAVERAVPWVREVLRRYLRHAERPVLLPVAWHLLREPFCDQVANVRARMHEQHCEIPGHGRLEQVTAMYRAGVDRLVVLGAAGAGKTVLAAHLAEDLLDPTDGAIRRLPVLVGLASWDPKRLSLRQWLTVRIVEEYVPRNVEDPSELAMHLIDSGCVLSVLDGFDEMSRLAQELAIEQLNQDVAIPFVLTSRTEEFARAVAAAGVLQAAACIEVEHLPVETVVDYLRSSPGHDSPRRWEPVLTQLSAPRVDPTGAALQDVLSAPLMLSLARDAYVDARSEPSQLLDEARDGDAEALRNHLIDHFVLTAYARAGRRPRYQRNATRWLTYLARHLQATGTRDIAWWRLGESLPPGGQLLAFMVVLGAMLAVTAGVAAGLIWGDLTQALLGAYTGVAEGALIVACFKKLLLVTPEPDLIRLRPDAKQVHRAARVGLIGGAFCTLVVVSLAGDLTLALRYGALTWFVGFLADIITARRDEREVAAPRQLLRSSRVNALLLLLLMVLVIWPSLWFMHVFGPGEVVVLPIMLLGTAWMRWIILARVWLPLTGRLPWRLFSFLEEAHRLGLLRQVGPAYQFRHRDLQERLCGTSESPARDDGPSGRELVELLHSTVVAQPGPTTLTRLADELDTSVDQLRLVLSHLAELRMIDASRSGPHGVDVVDLATIAEHARFRVDVTDVDLRERLRALPRRP